MVACLAALALAGDDFTLASFTTRTESPANRISAAPDFLAPTIPSSTIGKSAGGTPGFIKQGGTYRVYANVSDDGNPSSGVGTATGDVSLVTTGSTATTLTAGSFAIGGVSYNYRSAQLTANGSLSEGSKAYSVSATDNASNGPTLAGSSVTVDNTVPSGTDVQTANHGATAAKAELSDTITFTFSEPIDPASVLAAWTGTSTNVVVHIVNGALAGADTLQVFDSANSAQLPLGTVDLGGAGYVGGVTGGEIGLFGATGTASSMAMSGSTITITLGTASGQAATTALLNNSMTWTPSATATDRAGNAETTTPVTESGAADKEF
jgi:hypothetical protein